MMWKCPICNNEEKSKYVCRKCGYDTRKDFVQWRTVSHVPEEDAQERIKLKSGVWNENPSKETDTKKKEEPGKKSALGFKMPIPVKGFVLIALIAVFIVMGKDKNRIQSAGVTYEDDLDDLCVLGSDIKRNTIRTIAFLDTLKGIPADAWDVSEKQDGSVMAYIRNDNELYFAADGPIKANEDSSYFFAGYTNVEEIHFNEAFDTSDVTDMTAMFYNCPELDNVRGLNSLDLGQVTQAADMFIRCPKLSTDVYEGIWERHTEIEKNVLEQDFADGFERVGDPVNYFKLSIKRITFLDSLENIPEDAKDVSEQWDNSVMAWVEDEELLYIAADGPVIANPEDADLFEGYENVEEIHFNQAFDTSRMTNMSCMFNRCLKLKEVDLNGFDTSNVTDMSAMFCRCQSLESVDVSSFDTSNVTDMSRMFYYCPVLKNLDISSFKITDQVNTDEMFAFCDELSADQKKTGYPESGFQGRNMLQVTGYYPDELEFTAEQGYQNLYALEDIKTITFLDSLENKPEGAKDVSVNKDGSVWVWVEDKENLFFGADGPIIANPDSSELFAGYVNVKEIHFNQVFDTSNVVDMSGMFEVCGHLKDLDLSGFNTENVQNMHHMFYNCWGLTELNLSDFDTRNVTDMGGMFGLCTNLIQLDISNFNTSNVIDMSGMFSRCETLESLDVSNFDTSQVTDMRAMFANCYYLKSLDVSHFDMKNVSDTTKMFSDCDRLSSQVYEGIWDGN